MFLKETPPAMTKSMVFKKQNNVCSAKTSFFIKKFFAIHQTPNYINLVYPNKLKKMSIIKENIET